MKKTVLIALSAFCLMVYGCGRIYGPVEEAKAYTDHKEDLILQISKKLEASPNDAGVDEARKLFDAQKEKLKAEWKVIKEKPQAFNSDWETKFFAASAKHKEHFQEIVRKFRTTCSVDCSAAEDKLSAIEKEFRELA